MIARIQHIDQQAAPETYRVRVRVRVRVIGGATATTSALRGSLEAGAASGF